MDSHSLKLASKAEDCKARNGWRFHLFTGDVFGFSRQVDLANDRYEIADALHRFAFGLDHNHADSLASALTEDCRFDFTPAGKKLGIRFPEVNGRDAILQSVLPLIGPLDTTHSASNLQMEISGDTATLTA